jgi:8-amino-7-oxononanoate synthase
MATLDFCSSLYLGWQHPGHSLGDWASLSLGQPAALRAVPGSAELAQQLACLQGCAKATICNSTFHLFWDLFQTLSGPDMMIFLDQASYPVIGWGVERAACQGIPVQRFAAHAVTPLAQMLAHAHQAGWRPIIVTDGYAPSLGRAAPLARYAALAAQYEGLLVLDDTQALGLFGAPAGTRSGTQSGTLAGTLANSASGPWGSGGGGSLQAQQVFGPHILVGASLAKAFGAPLAVLAGDQALIQRFEAQSQTRMHASPPAVPVLRAAQQALRYNHEHGAARRGHLWRLLQHWWQGLAALGILSHGGPFPVQTLATVRRKGQVAIDWSGLHRYLAQRGTQAVLHAVPAAQGGKPGWQLSFILNAHHSLAQITLALRQIGSWWQEQANTHHLQSLEAL